MYITERVHNRACVGTLKAFDMVRTPHIMLLQCLTVQCILCYYNASLYNVFSAITMPHCTMYSLLLQCLTVQCIPCYYNASLYNVFPAITMPHCTMYSLLLQCLTVQCILCYYNASLYNVFPAITMPHCTMYSLLLQFLTVQCIPCYSETCSCDHLYSETTSIQGPLGRVPIVAFQCIFTSIKRPPLFIDHFFLAQAWSLNTGFAVLQCLTVQCILCYYNASLYNVFPAITMPHCTMYSLLLQCLTVQCIPCYYNASLYNVFPAITMPHYTMYSLLVCQNMNLALLSPRDSRIPRVCVPLKELPEGVLSC